MKITLRNWAKQVKERDGKCLECGRTEDLHAHHIKPQASHPELKFDLSNGRTLCYRCHKAEHEKNRPTRIRSDNPHRQTLKNKIEDMTVEIRRLRNRLKQFSLSDPLPTNTNLLCKCKFKKYCKYQCL